MATVDFTQVSPPSSANRRTLFSNQQQGGQARQESKLYGNFGYYFAEDPSVFISLPYGVPLDTMNPADTRGQNEDIVSQRHASNDLLVHMNQMAATLQPGDSLYFREMPDGDIVWAWQLRRKKEELEVKKETNRYAVNFGALHKQAAE